jgi:hypothetical protein
VEAQESQLEHTDFALAFQDGATFNDAAGTLVTTHVRPLGELVAPLGQIVVCDPLASVEMTPLAQRIAPGRYPVLASVAAMANDDRRIACAMLRLRDAPVIRWEMARMEGQDNIVLLEDEFFGYPVDAGVGCFMDAQAAAALEAHYDSDETYVESLIELLEANRAAGLDYATVTLDHASGANIIIFGSGFGDGIYASYWGYAADGALACLVTDFCIL